MASLEKIDIRLEEGTLLKARYRISRLLGTGGFAAVYEAEDTLINGRPVAVKVLNLMGVAHDAEQYDRAMKRFEREAQLAALIEHPNVVTVFDLGTTPNLEQPFIVMERLKGHNLGEELKQNGPMTPQRLLPLFCKALGGLAAGHAQSVIHKDLKPSNLFLVNPGEEEEDIRIVDFGIARLDKGSDEALTFSGQVAGTPQYMAPEYIQNQVVTPALDVYQMGLILAEALTGVRAVDEPNMMACLMRHSHGYLDLPDELRGSALSPILTRALALEPAERYASAREMRDELAEVDPAALPSLASPRARFGGSPRSGELISSTFDSGTYTPLPSPISSPEDHSTDETLDAPFTSTAPPAPAPNPRKLWPLGLLVVLILALAAGVWTFSDLSVPDPEVVKANPDSDPEPEAVTSDPAPQDPPRPLSKASQDTADAGQAPLTSPSEPPSEVVEVEIRTHPCKANLTEGKKSLGRAPTSLSFTGKGAEPRQITARCPGFFPRTFKVTPDEGPTRWIKLRPKVSLPDE